MQSNTWSVYLAYCIGLLTTDGNLSKDGRHMSLRSSDKDQLVTFKKILGLENKISQTYNNGYAKKPTYRMQFGNVVFYNWLLSLGLFPAKTHSIGEIQVPDKYFRDFIRGHLDGDGTIILYEDTYNSYKGKTYLNHRVFMRLISVSKNHIDWLYKTIFKLTHIKRALISSLRKNRASMWEIKYSKKASVQLFNWMYYSTTVPCLLRKRLLAEKAIALSKLN